MEWKQSPTISGDLVIQTSTRFFFTIDLFADDLLELVKAINCKSCILCGISMGGYIALRAAEKDPQAFSGIVLCDTTSLPDTDEAKIKRFRSISEIQEKGAASFAGNFVKNVFSEHTLSGNREAVEFIREIIAKTRPEVLCATLLALASRTDTSSALTKIDGRALIIRGEFDRIIGHDQALALYEGIRNATLVTVAGAGHLPNLENPMEFNRCLRQYLDSMRA